MIITINDILGFLKDDHIEFQYSGNNSICIQGFCSLQNLKPDSITWIKHADTYDFSNIKSDDNLLFITGSYETALDSKANIIMVADPKQAFFSILDHFFNKKKKAEICNTSVVETTAIGSNVSIGHHCYICSDAVIGNNVVINHNVSIESKCIIGDNTYIHSGVVIGRDGSGYYKINGQYQQVPHYGGVVIGNDVTIGANSVIDRGTIDDTSIGDNTKIDGDVFIAHNVTIGKSCLIVCGTQLCGSCSIGDDSYIAPHCVIKNQVKVGTHCMTSMGTVLGEHLMDGYIAGGNPVKYFKADYERLLKLSSELHS